MMKHNYVIRILSILLAVVFVNHPRQCRLLKRKDSIQSLVFLDFSRFSVLSGRQEDSCSLLTYLYKNLLKSRYAAFKSFWCWS